MCEHLIKKTFILIFALLTTAVGNRLTSIELEYCNPIPYNFEFENYEDVNSVGHRYTANEVEYCNPVSYNFELENCQVANCNSCVRFFCTFDLLYWRAFEDGLTGCGIFEASNFEGDDGENISVSHNRKKDLHFQWNPGFRLGIGQMFNNCWGMGFYWTSFSNKIHGEHKRKDECDNSDECDHLRLSEKLHWNLEFNTLDFVFGRTFNVSQYCLNVRPFVGLRGALIKQKFRSIAMSAVFCEDIENDFKACNKDREKLNGIGPFIGLEADWDIWCNFSFYGAVDFGILFGHFNIRSERQSFFANDISCCNNKKDVHACEAFADAALGISWKYCFCNCLQFELSLGIEHHHYFDHNRIGDDGDLCFDGATLSASFEY